VSDLPKTSHVGGCSPGTAPSNDHGPDGGWHGSATGAARGYEYQPLREMVHIEPGQRELTLRLRRWVRMNDDGWYSGDSHVHFLSAQGSFNVPPITSCGVAT
jgi:hypothetical protein